MQTSKKKYLHFVDFKDLVLWDVKRYYNQSHLQYNNIVSLRDILCPYKKKSVSKEEMVNNNWQIISKISIKGDLFLRDFEEINTYKGNLKLVPDNTIIYSKIGAKYGSIYFHESGRIPFGVSSEYPAYTLDNNKINGNFLNRVLRSNSFKQLIANTTTGISRARVKEDEFLSLQIPLPTLAEQNKIVENYYAKIQQAEALERENEEIRKEIEQILFEDVEKKNEDYSILKFVEYKQMTNWSVSHLVDTKFSYSNKFPLLKIGDFLIRRRDIINIDDETIYKRVKVKINSNGVVLRDREKGINIGTKKQYLAKFGQFIVSKIDARNGAFGVIPEELNNAIVTNDFPLYDVDVTKINPRFLPFVTTTKEFIKFAQSCSRGTTNRQRMDMNMFLEQKIPLPTLAEQEKLVGNYYENIQKAKILKLQAEQEFEEAIFSDQ